MPSTARRELHLQVEDSLPPELETPSIVTFWHSLEHLSFATIAEILGRIRALSSRDTRVVVCVPNAESTQFRALGEKYAYYDAAQHLHQFTTRSLDLLMQRFGFAAHRRCYSVSYSAFAAFGYLQGMLNCLSPMHNYLYYRMKRGASFDLSPAHRVALDAMNVALGIAFGPLAATLALHDRIALAAGGVITTCYRSEH